MCDATIDKELIVPIRCLVSAPKIKLEKMLKLSRFEFPVLKILLKTFWRQDYRFTFKLDHISSLNGTFSILKEKEIEDKFDMTF